MTDYTMTHPLWMWLSFGVFGSAGAVLFTLLMWSAMHARAWGRGDQRAATLWSTIGYTFLFFAAWFACGIAGPPGNLLSPDPAARSDFLATFEAILSMFFSVPGWLCVLLGQRRMLRAIHSEAGGEGKR